MALASAVRHREQVEAEAGEGDHHRQHPVLGAGGLAVVPPVGQSPGRGPGSGRATWPTTRAPTWTYQIALALSTREVDAARGGAEEVGRRRPQRVGEQVGELGLLLEDEEAEVVGDQVGEGDRDQGVGEAAAQLLEAAARPARVASRARRAGRRRRPRAKVSAHEDRVGDAQRRRRRRSPASASQLKVCSIAALEGALLGAVEAGRRDRGDHDRGRAGHRRPLGRRRERPAPAEPAVAHRRSSRAARTSRSRPRRSRRARTTPRPRRGPSSPACRRCRRAPRRRPRGARGRPRRRRWTP